MVTGSRPVQWAMVTVGVGGCESAVADGGTVVVAPEPGECAGALVGDNLIVVVGGLGVLDTEAAVVDRGVARCVPPLHADSSARPTAKIAARLLRQHGRILGVWQHSSMPNGRPSP
jgi:hypothetical protein